MPVTKQERAKEGNKADTHTYRRQDNPHYLKNTKDSVVRRQQKCTGTNDEYNTYFSKTVKATSRSCTKSWE
jgi:hypothetical protein